MTNLELTMLGILVEGPAHAYSIAKIVEERGIRDRTPIGFSTIYSALNKLQRAGYLQSNFEPQANLPGRRIYSLTERGRNIFHSEILKALSQPQRSPSLFETGLSFGQYLRKEQIKEALTIYEAELGRLIQAKVRELTTCDVNDQIRRALLTRPLTLWQAERKWIRELLNLL